MPSFSTFTGMTFPSNLISTRAIERLATSCQFKDELGPRLSFNFVLTLRNSERCRLTVNNSMVILD